MLSLSEMCSWSRSDPPGTYSRYNFGQGSNLVSRSLTMCCWKPVSLGQCTQQKTCKANVFDTAHDISFPLPCKDIYIFVFDGSLGGLLEGIFVRGADIPEMGHDPKATFAELFLEEDGPSAWGMCASGTFGLGRKVESAKEIFCIKRPPSKRVDVITVQL